MLVLEEIIAAVKAKKIVSYMVCTTPGASVDEELADRLFGMTLKYPEESAAQKKAKMRIANQFAQQIMNEIHDSPNRIQSVLQILGNLQANATVLLGHAIHTVVMDRSPTNILATLEIQAASQIVGILMDDAMKMLSGLNQNHFTSPIAAFTGGGVSSEQLSPNDVQAPLASRTSYTN